jgi:hypothetical protein
MKTSSFPNYYEILKVEINADHATIVEAFWSKTRELHADKRSSSAAAARFTSLFVAFKILISARRRRAYDALRQMRDDFDRAKAPEWKRYRDAVKVLTAEAGTLAELDLEALRRRIVSMDSLFFLRVIFLGEEPLSVHAWAFLIIKMAALAFLVVGAAHFPYAKIVEAAGVRFEELKAISDMGRALIGVGAGIGSFALFVGLLLAPAVLDEGSDSLVSRIFGGTVRLFLADQGAFFPAIPAVLAFVLCHFFWSYVARLFLS